MTESERLFLTNRDDLSHLSNTSQHFDHFRLAAIGENLLQFGRVIEMILDAVLAPARHEDDFFDSRVHRLLNDVLNRRNVDDRQKLLGDSFSSREKACSEAGYRYDRFFELHEVAPSGTRRSALPCVPRSLGWTYRRCKVSLPDALYAVRYRSPH